ncbi:MAG: hypothetical protein K6T85_15835 [Gorillibacterium sp.]|nr:hypothetical protein [Gorillibacterium sp.]
MMRSSKFIYAVMITLLLAMLLTLMGCEQAKTSPKLDLQPFAYDLKTIWATDPAGELYLSTDLAHHYVNVTPQGWGKQIDSQVTISNNLVKAFSTPNAKQAWMADGEGKVFRTYNGGKSWKIMKNKLPQQTDESMTILTFRDALHGWAQTGTDLYKSNDGGESWTLISQGFPQGGDSFRFITNQKGFQGRQDGLYSTENSGKDWVKVLSLPEKEIGFYLSPQFFSEKIGMLSVINNLGQQQKFFRTTDGGASWKTEIKPPLIEADVVSHLYFYNEKNGYAVYMPSGERVVNTIFHTKDGGLTWSETKPLEELMGTPLFVNAKEGIAFTISKNPETVNYTLVETSDGGLNWKSFIPLLKE